MNSGPWRDGILQQWRMKIQSHGGLLCNGEYILPISIVSYLLFHVKIIIISYKKEYESASQSFQPSQPKPKPINIPMGSTVARSLTPDPTHLISPLSELIWCHIFIFHFIWLIILIMATILLMKSIKLFWKPMSLWLPSLLLWNGRGKGLSLQTWLKFFNLSPCGMHLMPRLSIRLGIIQRWQAGEI